jgi:glyoxylase-like metal-dependent hydrolase (beta-lactamase superfamily II)
MIFKRYFLGCLAQASYLIGDEETGIGVVVDPQRDIQQYLADAARLNLSLRHVYLTHFHADFVSGHLEIRQATGAAIHLGAQAVAEYSFVAEQDGHRLEFGQVRIEALATPGHTPESITLLVYNLGKNAQSPELALTGDTLFIGDVGRPDLMASQGASAQQLGGMLYRSLREKLMTLPDGTLVYPAHGAGSLCGKNLGTEAVSTIGEQKRLNYALQPMSCDEFISLVTENQPEAPQYFAYDAQLNKKERSVALKTEIKPLSVEEVVRLRDMGFQLLDTRPEADFNAAHIKGAVQIGLGGKFATWAGVMLKPEIPIVLIAEPGKECESELRLGRIGYDLVAGFLQDGMVALASRPDLLQALHGWTAREFLENYKTGARFYILDVRTVWEFNDVHIRDAHNIPLAELPGRLGEVPRDIPVAVHCAAGYRSTIACSLLQRDGAGNVVTLIGGIAAVENLSSAKRGILMF